MLTLTLFIFPGAECGMTRCMEVSQGTALPMGGEGCVCQCGRDTPAFREDTRICVDHIDGNTILGLSGKVFPIKFSSSTYYIRWEHASLIEREG